MSADECAAWDCQNAAEPDKAWCPDCDRLLFEAGQQLTGQGGFR